MMNSGSKLVDRPGQRGTISSLAIRFYLILIIALASLLATACALSPPAPVEQPNPSDEATPGLIQTAVSEPISDASLSPVAPLTTNTLAPTANATFTTPTTATISTTPTLPITGMVAPVRQTTGDNCAEQLLTVPPFLADDESDGRFLYEVVQPGETFSSIAVANGTTAEHIQRANYHIPGPEFLQANQRIRVPLPGIYIVVAGETLWGIAAQHGLTLGELQEANRCAIRNVDFSNPDLVIIPEYLILRIPAAADEVVGPAPDCSPQLEERPAFIEYEVQPREDLLCLSLRFGLSPTTLLQANLSQADGAQFPAGTRLQVPPQDGVLYTLTAADIAQENILDQLAAWYLVPSTTQIVNLELQPAAQPLREGQQLFILGADPATPAYRVQLAAAPVVEPSAAAPTDVVAPSDSGATAAPGDSLVVTRGPGYRVWLAETDAGYCPLQVGAGWSGSLVWPIQSRPLQIGRGFQANHVGIDIDVPEGTLVYAGESGIVVWAGYSSFGGGIRVILAHGGEWRTHYAHLSEVLVNCGQAVAKGSLIGMSGGTGTYYPHLHFEVEQENTQYDPATWLP